MNENPNVNSEAVSSDEKLLALLCHLSSFFGGLILPVIIWATQKDKSKFVKFHSLQAIFFQIAFAVIVIFLVFVFLIILFAGIGITNINQYDTTNDMPPLLIFFMILFYGGVFVLVFGFLAYSVYLAVKSYKGEWIKIPLIGNAVYARVFNSNP